MQDLIDYVKAKDGMPHGFGPTTLSMTVSHSNLKQKWIEIRFDQSETIAAVKFRLYRHGGTPADAQKLLLLNSRGETICEMMDERRTLRDYGAQNDWEIRIVDLDNNSLAKTGWLEDTSLVEKYVMSEEDYEAREGTVRKYLQKKREEERERQIESAKAALKTMDQNIEVGKRCQLNVGARRGVIRFVGEATELGDGIWLGVELDEPMGKNDGTIKGTRYFKCRPMHGVMVLPDKLQVGDFPERSLSDDESDDEI